MTPTTCEASPDSSMSDHVCTLTRWAAALLLGLAAAQVAVAADEPVRLHVMHEIRDRLKLEGMNRHLQILCRQRVFNEEWEVAESKLISLPPAPNSVYYREESYFDGPREAHYATFQIIAMSADCRPMLDRSLSVKILNGCVEYISGANGASGSGDKPGGGVNLNRDAPLEPGSRPTCTRGDKADWGRMAELTSAVPVETIGGHACVWNSDLLSKILGAPVSPKPIDRRVMDLCLWREQPWYGAVKNRPVVIAVGSAHTAVAPAVRAPDVALAGLDGLTPVSTPVVVQAGATPPADRFTVEGARRFLSQPRLVPATAENLQLMPAGQ
ncbi:hypothetical protein AACH06_24895 [Ideonella sp. DXS29W]|uniref:Uncharacterized protein n=1 Tax=Ideonella lacteola TaxID=2984193 RepID=A0ABU9BVS9_9BURK